MRSELLTRPTSAPLTAPARPLSERQQTVLTLVTAYYAVAQEWPSSGWIARRLSISRQRARMHVDLLRSRGWLTR